MRTSCKLHYPSLPTFFCPAIRFVLGALGVTDTPAHHTSNSPPLLALQVTPDHRLTLRRGNRTAFVDTGEGEPGGRGSGSGDRAGEEFLPVFGLDLLDFGHREGILLT